MGLLCLHLSNTNMLKVAASMNVLEFVNRGPSVDILPEPVHVCAHPFHEENKPEQQSLNAPRSTETQCCGLFQSTFPEKFENMWKTIGNACLPLKPSPAPLSAAKGLAGSANFEHFRAFRATSQNFEQPAKLSSKPSKLRANTSGISSNMMK